MKILIISAIAALLLVLASVAANTAKAGGDVWEYPYECFAYQAGIWGNINGEEYICEYVGPYSTTGFAWIPQ